MFTMDGHVIAESWTFCTQKGRVCHLTVCESTEILTTYSAEPECELREVVNHSIETAGQTTGLLFTNTCMMA